MYKEWRNTRMIWVAELQSDYNPVVLSKAQGSEGDVAGIETQLCYSRN